MLTIGEENWIDRISPDDGGSCHQAGRTRLPLTVAAERGCMAIKGLERAVENPQPYQQNGGARNAAAMAI